MIAAEVANEERSETVHVLPRSGGNEVDLDGDLVRGRLLLLPTDRGVEGEAFGEEEARKFAAKLAQTGLSRQGLGLEKKSQTGAVGSSQTEVQTLSAELDAAAFPRLHQAPRPAAPGHAARAGALRTETGTPRLAHAEHVSWARRSGLELRRETALLAAGGGGAVESSSDLAAALLTATREPALSDGFEAPFEEADLLHPPSRGQLAQSPGEAGSAAAAELLALSQTGAAVLAEIPGAGLVSGGEELLAVLAGEPGCAEAGVVVDAMRETSGAVLAGCLVSTDVEVQIAATSAPARLAEALVRLIAVAVATARQRATLRTPRSTPLQRLPASAQVYFHSLDQQMFYPSRGEDRTEATGPRA